MVHFFSTRVSTVLYDLFIFSHDTQLINSNNILGALKKYGTSVAIGVGAGLFFSSLKGKSYSRPWMITSRTLSILTGVATIVGLFGGFFHPEQFSFYFKSSKYIEEKEVTLWELEIKNVYIFGRMPSSGYIKCTTAANTYFDSPPFEDSTNYIDYKLGTEKHENRAIKLQVDRLAWRESYSVILRIKSKKSKTLKDSSPSCVYDGSLNFGS